MQKFGTCKETESNGAEKRVLWRKYLEYYEFGVGLLYWISSLDLRSRTLSHMTKGCVLYKTMKESSRKEENKTERGREEGKERRARQIDRGKKGEREKRSTSSSPLFLLSYLEVHRWYIKQKWYLQWNCGESHSHNTKMEFAICLRKISVAKASVN